MQSFLFAKRREAEPVISGPDIELVRMTSPEEECRKLQLKVLQMQQEHSRQIELLQQKCKQLIVEKNELAYSGSDPLHDAIQYQLQALLADKAKLAEENCRLSREVAGLQELLDYTTLSQGSDDETQTGGIDIDNMSMASSGTHPGHGHLHCTDYDSIGSYVGPLTENFPDLHMVN